MSNRSADQGAPPRALALAILALAVPMSGAIWFNQALGDYGALLWLTALVPAFLLAYYRGWRGVATALAAGMAALSVTQAVVLLSHRSVPDLLLGVVVAYLAITLGIGWLAEALHRDRALVEDLAFTDLLTGLPNRRHAEAFLGNEFAAAQRGRELSVVLFDLDRFKGYNDAYGHPAGDEALRTFGAILTRVTRRMDLSTRFGGEEFLSILTATDADGAAIFADRIRAHLERTELPGGGSLTVSAGVASYHTGLTSPDELLAEADRALYHAKNAGRNQVRKAGDPEARLALEREEEHGGGATHRSAQAGGTGAEDATATAAPTAASVRVGTGRSALLVTRDSPTRTLVSGVLVAEGFEVEVAPDLRVFMDRLAREFDLALVDVDAGGSAEVEPVRLLRSRWPGTEVLALVSRHDPAATVHAARAGAQRLVWKPLALAELKRQVVDATNRRRRRAALRDAAPSREPPEELDASAREPLHEGLLALVRAAEARDPHTRGHGACVSRLAQRLVEAADGAFGDLNRESVKLGCQLLDVGKLALPATVLTKPGPLTEEEWVHIRRHPLDGRRILDPLPLDATVLAVVSWHHERWDGRGYPDGLSGLAIPVEARLAAVCDGLAAMCRRRAYRPAHAWDRVLDEIRRGAGYAYDPDVVRAVERCHPQLREIVTALP